ncbi:MAG: TcpE family conjugal transfer membrane protein [Streptococcus salivarius]
MAEERLYDYSKGLNAPYWIQEIKTKKGTRLWYFATPMQLSFFIVFTFVLWPCCSLEDLSWFLRKIHTLYFTTALLVSPL